MAKRDTGTRDALIVLALLGAGCLVGVLVLIFAARYLSLKFLAYVPRDVERSFGSAVVLTLDQSQRISDPESQKFLAHLMNPLVSRSDMALGEISLELLCEPAPNALAFPGGYIFVTSGMLNVLETDQELQGILGHELGHVAHRDSLTALGTSFFRYLVLDLVLGPLLGSDMGLSRVVAQITELSYSREQESSADLFVARLMAQEHGTIAPLISAFSRIAKLEQSDSNWSPGLTALSTHPGTAARIDSLKENATLHGWATDSRHEQSTDAISALRAVAERTCSEKLAVVRKNISRT